MGRKKHQDTEAGLEETFVPSGGNGPGGESSGLPKDKTQAVKLAMRDGVKSPTGIAEHVKTMYGMDITPNYVSVIKGKMKRAKKARAKAKQAQAEGQEKAAPRAAGAGKSGLSPE